MVFGGDIVEVDPIAFCGFYNTLCAKDRTAKFRGIVEGRKRIFDFCFRIRSGRFSAEIDENLISVMMVVSMLVAVALFAVMMLVFVAMAFFAVVVMLMIVAMAFFAMVMMLMFVAMYTGFLHPEKS